MVRKSVILLMVALVNLTVRALDTRTGVLVPGFASLQAYAGDYELADPVLLLGDDSSRLTVEFDELTDDERYMRYTLTHCNADWQQSGLVYSEYLEGFNEGYVTEREFSRATVVHYIHYSLTIPNEDITITASGNYLLRVYDESEPDETLLQVRFMVMEQVVNVGASISTVTDVDYNDAHQQLSIMVDPSNLQVHDPFNDFKVTVSQNNRQDNMRTLLHPLSLRGKNLIYEHLPELVFDGGNEYRRFETVSTRVPGMHVAETVWRGGWYQAWLETDTPRAGTPYLYDRTQQGGYVVREYNSAHPDTEADYVLTRFTLDTGGPLPDEDIYIDGDLICRRLDGLARMNYDTEEGIYYAMLPLKQGSYNYQYITVPRDADAEHRVGSTATIEGNYHNTVNQYRIAVYYRRPGDRYDRLVGYQTVMLQ